MRRWFIKHSKSTVRLTLTYLLIIVSVSLAYSFVMYRVTSRELVLVLQDNKNKVTRQTVTGVGVNPGSFKLPQGGPSPTTHSKQNLKQNLILLNSGVLVFGLPFCYFLARRTLRPIEESVDNQARFTSDAAHELRTPVAALRAQNEVALRNPNLTLKQSRKVMQNSIDQTIRLEKLSDALLQLSDEHLDKAKTSVHLEDVANEVMNIHISAAQSKHITITDDAPNISVYANRQDVVQIISILVDNAVKYSSPGSSIVIWGESDKKTGTVYVTDSGSGIRASDIPHIFDRFYRADHARTAADSPSYGLGLSIAKKLAQQNNGELSVQSELGKGSIFSLRLPLA